MLINRQAAVNPAGLSCRKQEERAAAAEQQCLTHTHTLVTHCTHHSVNKYTVAPAHRVNWQRKSGRGDGAWLHISHAHTRAHAHSLTQTHTHTQTESPVVTVERRIKTGEVKDEKSGRGFSRIPVMFCRKLTPALRCCSVQTGNAGVQGKRLRMGGSWVGMVVM